MICTGFQKISTITRSLKYYIILTSLQKIIVWDSQHTCTCSSLLLHYMNTTTFRIQFGIVVLDWCESDPLSLLTQLATTHFFWQIKNILNIQCTETSFVNSSTDMYLCMHILMWIFVYMHVCMCAFANTHCVFHVHCVILY